MTPVPAAKRGVCIAHPDCAVRHPDRTVRLYPAGWLCEPPDTRRNHPLVPKPAEEATP